MQKFKVGDTVRRVNGGPHLDMQIGDVGVITERVGESNYIINNHKTGSHKGYNLALVRPDELRAACLRTGQLIKQTPDFYDFTPGDKTMNCCKTQDGFGQARRVADLKAELEAAEAVLASQEELKERTRSINAEIRKHAACVQALSDVRDFGAGNATPLKSRPEYAEFRKELAEVIAPHGYKLVLIGDKSHAALVQA